MEKAKDYLLNSLSKQKSKLSRIIEKNQKYFKESPIINSLVDTSDVFDNNIESSFILDNKSVDVQTVHQDYLSSNLKEIIIFIPGLFNNEKVWIAREKKFGIASQLKNHGYYPIFLRFNPGLNIYQNGENLSKRLNELDEIDSNLSYHIVSYSQGGLFLRSALYYIQKSQYDWSKNLKKAIFISCPNKGSYLEKVGFKLIDSVSYFPIIGTQFFTLVANLRSSAMKDLSYGLIRKEESKSSSYVHKNTNQLYFGELDKVDCYQIYSLRLTNKYLDWIGDGIVEKSSLEYLSDMVFSKKKNPETRSICLNELGHVEIIYSPKTVKAILSCLKI